MLIYSRAPNSSYFYMSGEGEPPAPAPAAPAVKVEVEAPPAPAPAPAGPTAAEHAAVRSELESIRERLDAVADEAREWSKQEIQAALSRLENLEATATEGLKNLASQVTEMQTRLRDLLTRKSQEPQPGSAEVVAETPPEQPPEAPNPSSGEGEGQEKTGQPAPSGPAKPSKKVV